MRKNVFILGLLVAVMSLSFATLGVTVFTADRTANIAVANDDAGVLAINANDSIPFVVDTDGSSGAEFGLDTSTTGSSGVNVNSELRLGEVNSTGVVVDNREAFNVTNNFGGDVNVTVEYTLPSAQTDGEAKLVLTRKDSTGAEVATQNVSVGTNTQSAATFNNFSPNERIDAAVIVTTGTDTANDYSGTITFKAEQDQ